MKIYYNQNNVWDFVCVCECVCDVLYVCVRLSVCEGVRVQEVLNYSSKTGQGIQIAF